MKPRHLIALAAAAPALAVSLVAPSGADASICFASLPAVAGESWEIQQDGSENGSKFLEEGSNFAENHGALKVNGEAYPMLPDDQGLCTTTATTIQFPSKKVGGLFVSRSIVSIGGQIRHLDTIQNPGDETTVDVDFAVNVLGSQHSILSESGDAQVTSADHWSVHKNQGGSFPFLQWGVGEKSHPPTVISHGQNPAVWKSQFNGMPDATLSYKDLVIGANQNLRLLHMSGTTTSAGASETAAKDRLAPFEGLKISVAARVANWGVDADEDGVSKLEDECPSVKGDLDNGCASEKKPEPKDEVVLPKGGGGFGPETGPAPLPPSSGPDEEAPAPAPAPVAVRSARDTTAPVVRVELRRKVTRSHLALSGLGPRIGCDEACALTVKITGRTRGKRKASTLLTKSFARKTATRTLRLKPGGRKIRRLVGKRLTVVVTATDAAGNRTTVKRVVRIR